MALLEKMNVNKDEPTRRDKRKAKTDRTQRDEREYSYVIDNFAGNV